MNEVSSYALRCRPAEREEDRVKRGVTPARNPDQMPFRGSLIEQINQLEDCFNEVEPQVLAFLPEAGRFERLRRQARALEERYPDAQERPPLYGTLMGVKDLIHVEGFLTRAGTQVPPELLQGAEAECVTRLKRAGALVVGKTTTCEFAYTAPTPTRNPRHPMHTPGGSSSGSAAAVAAGMCALALGTQTIGSTIRPAAFCGVVGFKPSYDRVSRAGLIPLAPSLDSVGLFAPDVAGAARAASLLCADWKPAGLPRSKPVLGIPVGPYLGQASGEGRAHFDAVCQHLANHGYEIKPVPAMPDFDAIAARHFLILDAEGALVHAEWFAAYGERYEPQTTEMIRRGQAITPVALKEARAGRQQLRAELMTLMDAYDLDLWISPATRGPAPKGLSNTGNGIMNLPWTQSGLPALNLPAGQSQAGLPLGFQVAGRWYADEDLLAWSIDLEQSLSDFYQQWPFPST